jgi:hypothetical protein
MDMSSSAGPVPQELKSALNSRSKRTKRFWCSDGTSTWPSCYCYIPNRAITAHRATSPHTLVTWEDKQIHADVQTQQESNTENVNSALSTHTLQTRGMSCGISISDTGCCPHISCCPIYFCKIPLENIGLSLKFPNFQFQIFRAGACYLEALIQMNHVSKLASTYHHITFSILSVICFMLQHFNHIPCISIKKQALYYGSLRLRTSFFNIY